MKMKKLLSVLIFVAIGSQAMAQVGTYENIDLTHEYDQIRFIVPGEPRYYLMSKTSGTNNKALALYSAQDNAGGSWFFTVKEGTGDFIIHKGNVGIGTTTPNEKLTVNGTIYGKEVKVDLNVPAPDYVFEKDYNLPSLENIQNYIGRHKHLPGVPSAKALEENGINVGGMNMVLLKKVEELTLYVIELKEENEKQDAIIQQLQNKN
jgi:hypothetical protein